MVWRELLKSSVNELNDVEHFKLTRTQPYNSDLTLYQNYEDITQKIDCLAFRQVDEDVSKYQFPAEYLVNLSYTQRTATIFIERHKMIMILRVILVWSKNREIDGKVMCLSYTSGILCFIRRLLEVCNGVIEEVFWILTGVIRAFPQLFTI